MIKNKPSIKNRERCRQTDGQRKEKREGMKNAINDDKKAKRKKQRFRGILYKEKVNQKLCIS